MATIMMIVMIGLLLLGFPMMIPLTTAAVIGFVQKPFAHSSCVACQMMSASLGFCEAKMDATSCSAAWP